MPLVGEKSSRVADELADAAPGSVVYLPDGIRPVSVNVVRADAKKDEVLLDPGEGVSLDADACIIPLIVEKNTWKKDGLSVSLKHPLTGAAMSGSVQLETAGYDLRFGFSFHKVQGGTRCRAALLTS